jgi:importin subunit beta-1
MAGATCLTLIAKCVRNDILQTVVPYVTQHLNSSDWRKREAADMAFGSILEGVTGAINPLIVQVYHFLFVFTSSQWHVGNSTFSQAHAK